MYKYTSIPVYVHFNRFIDLTINSHTEILIIWLPVGCCEYGHLTERLR